MNCPYKGVEITAVIYRRLLLCYVILHLMQGQSAPTSGPPIKTEQELIGESYDRPTDRYECGTKCKSTDGSKEKVP